MYCYIQLTDDVYTPSSLVLYSIKEVKLAMNTRWFIDAKLEGTEYKISPWFKTYDECKVCLNYLLSAITDIIYADKATSKVVIPKKLIEKYCEDLSNDKDKA